MQNQNPSENPTQPLPAEVPMTTAEKAKVGGAIAGLVLTAGAALGVGVNAMANPDHGTSNQPGNVTVQFHENGTAWDAAKEIKDTDADLRDLAGKIQEQTDAQGDPGVQAFETAVLPAADLSQKALKEYVIPTKSELGEVTPTSTPSEVIVDDNNMVTPAPSETVVDDNNMVTPAPAEATPEKHEKPSQNNEPQEVVPDETPVIENPDQPHETVPNDTPVIPNPSETAQPDQPEEVVPGGTPVIPNPDMPNSNQ